MSLSRGPLFESAGRVQASSPLPANSRPSEAERQQELAQERAARVRQARQRERWHNLRAELANDSTTSSRNSPNPNTTLGERVDPSTLTSERTLERYLEQRADRTAGTDRWERVPASTATAARLPTFMSQGGEILLRRSQLRGGYSGREIGVRTAGLAMTEDGRTLWAACEEGIFEIPVALKRRMFLGAVDPR